MRVIVWCGIQLMPDNNVHEVIHALEVQSWRKGLATEAARRLTTEALALDFPRIEKTYAQVFPQNSRSIAVLSR